MSLRDSTEYGGRKNMKAKKIITFVLAVMLMCVPLLTVNAEEDPNLLANGNFNEPGLGMWWMRGDWPGGYWTYSSDLGYEETGCLVCTGRGDGGPGMNAGLFYTSQEGQEASFQLIKGEPYKLSFKCNKNGNDCDIYMDVNEGAAGSGHANSSGKWQGVEFTFKAPSGAVKIRCVVNGLAEGGQVAIDDITLVCLSGKQKPEGDTSNKAPVDLVTTELGDNLLSNGNFNNADFSKWWLRTDWNGGYFTPDGNHGIDGSGCLMAVGEGEGTPACNAGVFYTAESGVENYLALEKDKTYQVDASFYRPEGISSLFYIDINEGGGGAGVCTTNEEWEHISFRFVAPEAPIKIRIVANALKPGQNCYVDDVMIREVGGEHTEVIIEEVPEGTPTISAAVDYSNLPPEEEPAEEEQVVPEEEPVTPEEPAEEGLPSHFYYVIAGSGVLVLGAAAAIIAVIVKNKKKAG